MKEWWRARRLWSMLEGRNLRRRDPEMEALHYLWNELSGVVPPVQGADLPETLHREMTAAPHRIPAAPARRVWIPRAAAAIILLCLGFVTGHFTTAFRDDSGGRRMAREVHQVRRMLMFSLLNRDSAAERMRAVHYLVGEAGEDPRVAGELVRLLDTDPDVNVRLECIYALAPAARQSANLRRELARSLHRQDSPLLQLTLVDLLQEWHDSPARDALDRLNRRKDLDLSVRARLGRSIKQL